MTPQPAPASDRHVPDAAPAPAVSLVERQAALLGRLAEAGLNIAIALERQAMAPLAAEPPDDPAAIKAVTWEADETPPPAPRLDAVALAFARVSRAVRQTLLLQSHLLGEAKRAAVMDSSSAAVAAISGAPRRREQTEARKARIERIVLRVADDALDGVEDGMGRLDRRDALEGVEDLEQEVADALERCDDDDIWGLLLDRPGSEVVDQVCRDLGLSPDWPRLAQEAWAKEEVRDGPVGAPLAGFAAWPQASAPPQSWPPRAGPDRSSPTGAWPKKPLPS